MGVMLLCVEMLAACSSSASSTGRSSPASPTLRGEAPIPFPVLEGVYRETQRSYVVTYQGWWLDMQSQQIRALHPLGGGTFTYGSGWQVTSPAEGTLHFERSAAGSVERVTGTGPGGVEVDATRMHTTQRDVMIPSRGAVLAGTITMPPGPGRHPALVILQGSGPLDRHFESISQGIYLSMGFAVLAFDKRGVGQSTGAFVGELATPQSIETQAIDAASAANFLIRQPHIDPHQVGFDGNSQGGWVAPLAAEHVPGLKFAILIASPAVTSEQQSVYASFSGGSQYVPTQSDAAIDVAVRATTGGYDPRGALTALHVAALWIYGALDRQVPVRVCVDNLIAYHNPVWTVDVLPGGSHGTIETRHGLDSEVATATRFAGHYFADVRAWVAAHVVFPAVQ